MSQSNNKPVALVLGAAVATGTLVAGSLFSMQAMANGYMQDAKTETKAAEGKCGEGKCGAKPKAAEGKCGMSMADTNKDGKVSPEERKAQAAKMREMHGKRGAGRTAPPAN